MLITKITNTHMLRQFNLVAASSPDARSAALGRPGGRLALLARRSPNEELYLHVRLRSWRTLQQEPLWHQQAPFASASQLPALVHHLVIGLCCFRHFWHSEGLPFNQGIFVLEMGQAKHFLAKLSSLFY